MELNWLTEHEIAGLEMLDDEPSDGVVYSCFQLEKDKLSLEDMKVLARKVNSFQQPQNSTYKAF